ncbi:pyrroline-5-carboxylate reductase [Alkaliphilus transvaalensis]|uniref:pyrroline-5-carboxylate reductase n=1 Tax=Alkaliphilus transvaalensis TaxID=114628 RepID=UPI0004797E71|nr:pyrroline-5-carboxylate reductase [Alkaliphilus transvaalensis]
MDKRIGFIGVGKMAQTIITGLVESFDGINELIFITNRTRSKGEIFSQEKRINLCDDNLALVNNSDVIFLSIKPDQYHGVLEEIKDFVRDDQIIVSMAAGIAIKDLENYFTSDKKILRIMPNVAVAVREGITVISQNKKVLDHELKLVVDLLNSIGKVDVIEEAMIDMVTTVSGCSPAFVAQFAEALADGAVLQGVPRDKAYQFAAQALLGTAKMLLELQLHPGELKDLVTSPGGVTVQGVATLEKLGFRGAVIEAMEACGRKIQELAE